MTFQLSPAALRRIAFLADEKLIPWLQRFRAERGLPPLTEAEIERFKAEDREEFMNIPEERRNW